MVTLHPVPKPSRIERLRAKEAQRQAKRAANKRQTFQKHHTTYGGSDWQAAKARIWLRDKGRCLLCDRRVPDGTAPHHIKKVAAGGKNEDTNLILLCPLCHAAADEYRYDVLTLRQVLAARYGHLDVTYLALAEAAPVAA